MVQISKALAAIFCTVALVSASPVLNCAAGDCSAASPGTQAEAATPVFKREDAISKDLSEIEASLGALDASVTAFDGSLGKSIPISMASGRLNKAIQKAAADTKAVASFSEAQSAALVKQAGGLSPKIVSTVDNLAKKQPQFKSAGLSGIVLSQIKGLQTSNSELTNSLVSKVAKGDTEAANAVKSSVEGAFTKAIAAFSA